MDINKYLHYYIGSASFRVEHVDDPVYYYKEENSYGFWPGATYKLSGYLYQIIKNNEEGGELVVKLILRKLSSMSDQEKLQVYQLAGGPSDLSDESKLFQAEILLTTKQSYKNTNLSGKNWLDMYDYLIRQGVWVFGDDAFDKDLIIETGTI